MKWLSIVAIFISFQAFAAEPRSFDIVLTGRTAAGPHPNEAEYVRKMYARFVENLKVRKYLLRPTPANGGFHVCIEPVAGSGYDFIVDELSRIAIRNSVWEVKLVHICR